MEKTFHQAKKFGTYVNEKGRLDVLKFFEDHKKFFPTLWMIVQCEAARGAAEVGCEHFFDFLDTFHHPVILG
jgi:hypothetical protein